MLLKYYILFLLLLTCSHLFNCFDWWYK